MFGINNLLDNWAINRTIRYSALRQNEYSNPLSSLNFRDNLPTWVALDCPEHYEYAYRFNPVVKAVINLIAASSSNGNKFLKDAKTGERIDWNDKSEIVQKIKKLIIDRPNPLQSAKEFEFQGIAYLKTFGNRYINNVMPSGFNKKLDILNVNALWNLPSQYMELRTTGKIYNQTKLENIISDYARTNTSPIELYKPHQIIHLNEVNISTEQPTIIGLSKLEAIKDPISNTQGLFQFMRTLIAHRGMGAIVSPKKQDGTGATIPLNTSEQEEVNKKFKADYGFLNEQNPFLWSPVPLDVIKTVMNSKELGVYEEFSNNSILISNEFNVPPELVKTYIAGATYENQEQSVKRLYQDVTIPQVTDYDAQLNYAYNIQQYGVILYTDWSHIPALAENKKDEATSNSLNSRVAMEEYKENLITWNQYLAKTGQKTVIGGDKYKWELDKQRNINNSNLE